MRPRISKHDLGMLLVALIWGANFSANKYALRFVPPVAFSAGRFLLASLLLLLLVELLRPGDRIPPRKAWLLMGLGVVGNTGYQVAFMTGLATTSAINAALILAALPTLVALLSAGLGVERVGGRLWFGILVATVGVVLVIVARGVRISGANIAGDLLVLVACFCWAAFTVGVRHVGAGLPPLRVTAITTIGGTPGLLLVSGAELGRIDWQSLPGSVWIALLYSAIFAVVVAYILWSYAVQGIGGSRVALYNCVIPVFAALVAWAVLGERPVPIQAAGAALVFAGVFLSQGPSEPGAAAVKEPLPRIAEP